MNLRSSRIRPAYYLLFPGLLAALTVAIPDWHFSSPFDVDPWVYYGYFRHFRSYTTQLFAGTYYGTRLGWTVPGHLVYAIFDPERASFVLHAACYTIAVGSLFAIVNRIAGILSAVAGATFFGLYLPIVRGLGSDYVEAPVITYSLVSAALMQRAGSAGPLWAAAASGFSAGAMLHSNLGSVFLFPSLLLWAVPFSRVWQDWRNAAARILVWIGGAVACTLVLGVVSVATGGQWMFFVPSVTWLASMGTTNPWDRPGLAWMMDAPWVFLPIATMLCAAVVAISRHQVLDEARLRAVGALVATLLIFAGWDFIGPGATLFWPFYASWLVPGSMIVLASVCLGTLRMGRRSLVLATLVGTVLLWTAARPDIARLPLTFGLSVALVLGLATVAAAVRSPSTSLALLGLMLAHLNAWVATTDFYRPLPNRADAFRAVNQGLAISDRYVDNHVRPLLVLERNPAMSAYFNSFASTFLFGYVVVSDTYPEPAARPAQPITSGAVVIILSTQAHENLRLAPYFAAHGMAGDVIGHERITTAVGFFDLTFVRAAALPTDAHDASASPRSGPG
jgi:hypothetical protein